MSTDTCTCAFNLNCGGYDVLFPQRLKESRSRRSLVIESQAGRETMANYCQVRTYCLFMTSPSCD